MAITQFRSKRKVSGKKYKNIRKVRVCDLGKNSIETIVSKRKVKVVRGMGGNTKQKLLSEEFVLVYDNKKSQKIKIDGVEQNPANQNYTRRNIITKGCILKTEKGKVKVTSRPGQVGQIQGIFLKE